ncbi:MAG: DUF4363 family protein [Clostridia bacterium]|nr:DUF4363 family protein [Clostridia bacterium]
MKRIIAAAVLLSVIIAACISGNILIKKYCEDTTAALEELKNGYTEQKAENLNKIWNGYRTYLFIFVNHETLEDIEKDIKLLNTYMNADEEEFLTVCDEIKYDINIIKEKEKFSIISAF